MVHIQTTLPDTSTTITHSYLCLLKTGDTINLWNLSFPVGNTRVFPTGMSIYSDESSRVLYTA